MVDWTLGLRVVHIAATCTSLGGLVYARAVLWPLLDSLPAAEREPFLQRAIRRFAAIKWTGVSLLAVTGVVQWTVTWPHILDRSAYVAFFALKMVGAVGLFSITFLLTLPVGRLGGMQARRGFWSALNVLCGLTILVGAALMRTVARA
jgi:uncharacterized membrane protein